MATEEGIQRIAKSYVHRLARTINIRRAILTGSWANGDYMEDSDVDMIIVSDDFARMSLPERLKYLQREWKSKIPLEAFGYTESEFRNLSKKSTYVKDAIRNGVSLTRNGIGPKVQTTRVRGRRFMSSLPGFNYREEQHEASRYLFGANQKTTRRNR